MRGTRQPDPRAGESSRQPHPDRRPRPLASARRLRWAAPGDVNGVLGLAPDNVTNLVILGVGVFKFPADLVLQRMIPGTALGVLVGDVVYTIGLEITAQAFLASPARHGAAVALIEMGGWLAGLGRSAADLTGDARLTHQTLLVLGNGFILTSVLWGSALVCIIDRRHALAAGVFALASAATLFGAVHSPLPSDALFWPWAAGTAGAVALPLAGTYGVAAATCWLASGRQDR